MTTTTMTAMLDELILTRPTLPSYGFLWIFNKPMGTFGRRTSKIDYYFRWQKSIIFFLFVLFWFHLNIYIRICDKNMNSYNVQLYNVQVYKCTRNTDLFHSLGHVMNELNVQAQSTNVIYTIYYIVYLMRLLRVHHKKRIENGDSCTLKWNSRRINQFGN